MQKWSCSQALKIKDQLTGGETEGKAGVGGMKGTEGTDTTSGSLERTRLQEEPGTDLLSLSGVTGVTGPACTPTRAVSDLEAMHLPRPYLPPSLPPSHVKS